MNKERRKLLADALAKIEPAKELLEQIQALLEEIKTSVEEAKDAEQEYFDNMPESLQQGERGQGAEAAVSTLEEAFNSLENMIDAFGEIDLDEIASQIEEAST